MRLPANVTTDLKTRTHQSISTAGKKFRPVRRFPDFRRACKCSENTKVCVVSYTRNMPTKQKKHFVLRKREE